MEYLTILCGTEGVVMQFIIHIREVMHSCTWEAQLI